MIPASFVRTVEVTPDGVEHIDYLHPDGWYFAYWVNLTVGDSIAANTRCYCDSVIADMIHRHCPERLP